MQLKHILLLAPALTAWPCLAQIPIIAPPSITTQPQSRTVLAGSSVTFNVSATGFPAPAYQWQKNSVPLTDDSRISGATNNVLTINNVQVTDAGQYSVIATNPLAYVTSASAALVVRRDTNRPTVTIQSPLPAARLNQPVCIASGRATDNVAVTNVWLQLNNSAWASASTTNGWTNWTAEVTLSPGTNILRACAADPSGNRSLTNKVAFVLALQAPVTVSTNGCGTVTPNYNGAMLELGRTYTMTAAPALGFAFAGWTGSIVTNKPVLSFRMASNLTFIANFVDVQRPTLSFYYPNPAQPLTYSSTTVSWRARDNAAVAKVFWQINGQNWIEAVRSAEGELSKSDDSWWSANLALAAGTNTIQAFAQDAAGNLSTTNKVKLVYVPSAMLEVGSAGRGTITPNYNGMMLAIGKTYSMTATASPGFAFTNWTGSVTTNKATLTFVMRSNLTFNANFVDVTRPTLVVNSPAVGQRVTNALITVVGSARDNVAVAQVRCQLNGGQWTQALTTNNWTNWFIPDLMLTPGTNVFSAYALDDAGRCSPTNTVRFVYVFNSALFPIDAIESLPAGVGEDEGQINPAIAFDGTNYLVAFQVFDAATNPAPAAQLVSPTGMTLGSQFNGTGRAGEAPLVAFDGTNFLLAWVDVSVGGSRPIYGQFLDRTAIPVGPAFQMSQSTTVRALGALTYGGGSYLLTWTDSRYAATASDKTGFARLITPAGAPVCPEFQLAGTGTAHTTAAFDGTNFLAIWREDSDSGGKVNGRLIGSLGELRSDAFLIEQPPFDSSDNAVLFDGQKYLVVINSFQSRDDDVSKLVGRFVQTDGQVSAQAVQLVGTNASPKFPHIAFDGSHYLLTWLEVGGDVPNLSQVCVKAQFFDSNAILFGPERKLFAPVNNRIPLGAPVLFDGAKFFAATEYAALVQFVDENPVFTNGAVFGAFIAQPGPVTDWAPQSLSGRGASVTLTGMPGALNVSWGDTTFAQTGPAADTSGDNMGVGTYTYFKTSTNTAVLRFNEIGVLRHLGSSNSTTVNIRFTSPSAGTITFINDDQSVGSGKITLSRLTNTVPASVVGKTVRISDASGLMSTMSFGNNTFTEVNRFGQPGQIDSGIYSFIQFSPTVAMLQLTYTDRINAGVTTYCQVKFSTASRGTLYFARYDDPSAVTPESSGPGIFTVE